MRLFLRAASCLSVASLLLSALPANSVGLQPIGTLCKNSVQLGDNKYVAIALDRSGSYDLRTEWRNYKEQLGTYASALFGDVETRQGPITLKVFYIGNDDLPAVTISAVKLESPAFKNYWNKVCYDRFAKDNMIKSAKAAQNAIQQIVLDGDRGQACEKKFVQIYRGSTVRREPIDPNRLNLQGFVCDQLDSLRAKIETVSIGPLCRPDKPCSNILQALERAAGGVPSGSSASVSKCVAVFSDGMNFDTGHKRDANPTNMYNLVLKTKTTKDEMKKKGRKVAGSMDVNWGKGPLKIQLIGYVTPTDASLTNEQRNRLRSWWSGIAEQWSAPLEVKDTSEVCQ